MTVATALFRLDEFLLDRVFQPLTDRLGDKPSAFDVGMSLELGAVVLELAADIVLFGIHELSMASGLWDGFSCACGIWFYSFMVRHRPLVRPGHANPLRLIYRSLRLLALGFAVWSVWAAVTSDRLGLLSYTLSAASNFVFVAGMHLIACQPRPPGWRAVKREATVNPWAAASLGQ